MAACRFIKPTKFLNLSTHVGYWFLSLPAYQELPGVFAVSL
nr:MAG TPA: hypothetical protein [Caudoviricetes sp.]